MASTFRSLQLTANKAVSSTESRLVSCSSTSRRSMSREKTPCRTKYFSFLYLWPTSPGFYRVSWSSSDPLSSQASDARPLCAGHGQPDATGKDKIRLKGKKWILVLLIICQNFTWSFSICICQSSWFKLAPVVGSLMQKYGILSSVDFVKDFMHFPQLLTPQQNSELFISLYFNSK